MPSRTGMIIISGRGGRGDPFFGALARLAFKGVGAIVKRVRGAGLQKTVSGAIQARGALVRSPATGKLVRIAKAGAGALGFGAAFEAGSAAVSGLFPGPNGELLVKKRRGINPLNPKAARRAVSRLCRLQVFTDRLEHSLSDLVKRKHHGHHHHRR